MAGSVKWLRAEEEREEEAERRESVSTLDEEGQGEEKQRDWPEQYEEAA